VCVEFEKIASKNVWDIEPGSQDKGHCGVDDEECV